MTDKTMGGKRKDGISPIIAGVAGAVIGAGIVAGAVLSDKNNRERVKKTLIDAKDQAVDYVEGMQKQAKDKKEEVETQLTEDIKNTNRKIKKAESTSAK